MGSKRPRPLLVAGNWKMNHGLRETDQFFLALRSKGARTLARVKEAGVGACIFPSFLALQWAKQQVVHLGLPVEIGAQNAHWEPKGAFTGEVSGPMLKENGIHWALVGHSERRQFFGETDETVRKRGESLLNQDFRVVLCVGETQTERTRGETALVIKRQILGALPEPQKGMAYFLDGRLVVAYEPVWAIGTGLTATPEQAQEVHSMIRILLKEKFGSDAAAKTQILYGGSVTPENVDSILNQMDVDGVLVGGASLKPEGFLSLLESAVKASS